MSQWEEGDDGTHACRDVAARSCGARRQQTVPVVDVILGSVPPRMYGCHMWDWHVIKSVSSCVRLQWSASRVGLWRRPTEHVHYAAPSATVNPECVLHRRRFRGRFALQPPAPT